ncbi:MAG TPA: choice-of-anchor Q domain-containing protein [Candidatus Udaeobacter sp.]|nr:choice-of-anchor Q domain-containing protein [Candidatus Udaeobacter sp.]
MLSNQNYQLLSSFERRFVDSILWIGSVIFVTCCCAASANVLHVPADFATIQRALDAASPGDSILVAEGTYTENIVWPQTSDLRLLSDPANRNRPTIDGASAGRVIDIEADGGGAFAAEISGFVITHGFLDVPAHTGETGAGIFMSNGALRLSRCVIDANAIASSFAIQNNGGGAGVSIVSTPAGLVNRIEGCIFLSNSVSAVTSGDGAAIHLDGAPLVMKNTEIRGNRIEVGEVGLGTIYDYASDLVLESVKVEQNRAQTDDSLPVGFAAIKGTGVFSYLSNVRIVDCKIANNLSTPQNSTLTLLGAAVYFYSEGTTLRIFSSSIGYNKRTDGAATNGTALYFSSLVTDTAVVANSILWNPGNGPEIDSFSKPAAVSFTDDRDNPPGNGNLDADPLFVSPLDFHLQPTSPCLNAGDNQFAPPRDIEGTMRPLPAGSRVDLGCYEME